MKQQRQNVRSTKVKQNTKDNQEEETHQNKPQAKLKDVYVGPQIGMAPKSLWGLPNLEY